MAEKLEVHSVDAKTGEKLDYAVVAIAQKTPSAFGKRWIQMAQDPLTQIAEEIKSVDQMRVLIMLISRVDFENWISVDQTEISQKLSMKPPNVSRAIKGLIEKQIVLKGPKIGHSVTYRLNPSYGWKGRAKGHREALRERMEAKGLSVVPGTKKDDDDDDTGPKM